MGGQKSKLRDSRHYSGQRRSSVLIPRPDFAADMGSKESKPEEPKFLKEPWREIDWGNKEAILQSVKDYKPLTEDQHIRILLYGPGGAGKSSFINSVLSVLHGRMYAHALTANIYGESFTRKNTAYKIQKEGQRSFYPFVFNDTMGLSRHHGVHTDDVKLALKGHMKEGYRFNPGSKLSEKDPDYIESPTDDGVHVLVCVFPADICLRAPQEILQKIKDIRGAATDLDIPQVVILTKIDEAHPEIKEDLKNVYKVTELKEQMEKCSTDVEIPMICIFPVKNYSEEIDLIDDMGPLILSKNIIGFGDDYQNLCEPHSGG